MSGEWGDNDNENRGRVSRVIIDRVRNDGPQQRIDYEGVDGEKHTDVLRIQVFGFTNNPPAGAEGVVLAMNARDAPVLLGIEHPEHRPADDPGGSSRQYDAAKSTVYLDGAGNVHIEGASGTVTVKGASGLVLEAPTIQIKGDIEHTGNMSTSGVHIDSNGPHTA